MSTSNLYDPALHEPICSDRWSPQQAVDTIHAIVGDFSHAQRSDRSWPNHPLCDHANAAPKWCAYFGAAGAIVSLRILARAGYPARDASDGLAAVHESFLAHPDVRREPGLQLGEIGILAPAVLADPENARLASRLEDRMIRILGHPAREITSGETGMLHAALTLFRKTGDERWLARYRVGAESLWKAWEQRPETGDWLWTSDIFGSVRGYYGACHGLAGNVEVLLRGVDLLNTSLPSGWLETAMERTTDTLARGALRDGDVLNWCVSADPSGQRRMVQWCHGAPGVVAALGAAPKVGAAAGTLESLLLSAGEFVWRAGPVAKGPGLCHGTAGNGYAFLRLYVRTGDEMWLERARRFAMHAIAQSERARRQFGQRRYSLWTGDGGLAVYLHHCVRPQETAFPGLEIF